MPSTNFSFSKLSKEEKIRYVVDTSLTIADDKEAVFSQMKKFWNQDPELQKVFDEFAENTLSNYYLPYGIAPGFVINHKEYAVPMVIEESSVVAAASRSAKFWRERGGFKSEILSTTKVGQVHLHWEGHPARLQQFFKSVLPQLRAELRPLVENMEKRGGGVKDIVLKSMTDLEPHYHQIYVTFETCNAMGANFINTCLEKIGHEFKRLVEQEEGMGSLMVIMSILSNYTPECRVRASVECPVERLAHDRLNMTAEEFAFKFTKAVRIAEIDVHRATTHNKGIFNGIDAVVLATGNDFRAVEAAGHAYAARNGHYQSLSEAFISEKGNFNFSLEIPLALGTIGGLTSLHPLAKISLQLLGNPSSTELMGVVAAVGLAQNFAAVNSLVTTGIQKGHMRMHLLNILNGLKATEQEKNLVSKHFAEQTVSYTAVRNLLESIRRQQ